MYLHQTHENPLITFVEAITYDGLSAKLMGLMRRPHVVLINMIKCEVCGLLRGWVDWIQSGTAYFPSPNFYYNLPFYPEYLRSMAQRSDICQY